MAIATQAATPDEDWESVRIAKVCKELQQPSSKAGMLYWVVSNQPTNYDMLIFRTLNQILKAPAHNQDHLAAALRDELMPARSWWLKNVPWAPKQLKSTFENRLWGVPGCINFIDARTKWFDAAVKDAVQGGTIKQVVAVAAGYDTRAYRFAPADKSVSFFEVDLPEASSRKQKLASKLSMVPQGMEPPVYVPADLSKMDLGTALASTGFNPALPTLFTVEGLIYYLPPSAARKLFKRIMQLSAPGSKAVFDFMHAAALEGKSESPLGFKYTGFKTTTKSVASKGEPYKFGLEDSAVGVSSFLKAASKDANAEGAAGEMRLCKYLGPKDMIATQLPHIKWNNKVPPIAPFYSYAMAEKAV